MALPLATAVLGLDLNRQSGYQLPAPQAAGGGPAVHTTQFVVALDIETQVALVVAADPAVAVEDQSDWTAFKMPGSAKQSLIVVAKEHSTAHQQPMQQMQPHQ